MRLAPVIIQVVALTNSVDSVVAGRNALKVSTVGLGTPILLPPDRITCSIVRGVIFMLAYRVQFELFALLVEIGHRLRFRQNSVLTSVVELYCALVYRVLFATLYLWQRLKAFLDQRNSFAGCQLAKVHLRCAPMV